ncbi:MAG: hypothetical protein SynsKO_14930 [Synoicihabitans sp.]
MSREILFHTAVQRDIRNILEYYEAKSGSLADTLWTELTEAFEYARQFPERHHFDPSGRRRSNLNGFPITSYSGHTTLRSK